MQHKCKCMMRAGSRAWPDSYSAKCMMLACTKVHGWMVGSVNAWTGAKQNGAHLDRPLPSMMTSARSMFCVLAAKASFRFCHVQLQGRLCTTTCI